MRDVSDYPRLAWRVQRRTLEMSAAQRALIGAGAAEPLRMAARQLPGNLATPLHRLPVAAAGLDLGTVLYKDEGLRCGIGNFKALGAAVAIYRLLAARATLPAAGPPSLRQVMTMGAAEVFGDVVLAAATAGSHGRAVAWAASLFGCRAAIFTHADVDAARREAIAAYGADVTALDCDYDASVAWVFEQAEARGWTVVSDTAVGAYRDIPTDIMRGYTIVADEVIAQLPADETPTHVFVQAGVGGLAAAVCGRFWEVWGEARPQLVVVEPVTAAGFLLSAAVGTIRSAPEPVQSTMLGLAAGRPSDVAWEILATGADAFVVIPDAAAREALDLYAGPGGELATARPTASAIAGLAALHQAARHPEARAALGLDRDSRVLLIGTDRELAG